ncbi:MAG: FmdB family zinc ribbon protein [Egibacteraceae bacterium]
MPTYEYACRECGQHLEVVQSFKDEALTTCGTCGGSLRKVFSAAGIIFKGSGYYVTDTRQKQAKSSGDGPAAKDGKDAKKSGSGDSTPSTSGSDSAKSGDAKGGDAKAGDAKAGDGKSGDGKSSGSKSSEHRGTAESA